MAILSKNQLLDLVNKKELDFSPNLDAYQIQPTSIDLRIGWSFYIPYTWKLTEKGRVALVADYMDYSTTHENFQLIKLRPGQYFEILPGESVIASTLEKVSLKNDSISAMLYPRSSASRRGISIESGVINPHYSGHLIIPLQNTSHHALKVYPGERLCQLVFNQLAAPMSVEDASKHGLGESKYKTATPYGLNAKLDSHEELDMLREGRLDDIKQKYNATTPPAGGEQPKS